MEPKTRIWVDARNEAKGPKTLKNINYCFKEELTQEMLQKIYQAVGYAVMAIELLPNNSLNFSYDTQRVTLTYLDFALQKQGLQFTREGG